MRRSNEDSIAAVADVERAFHALRDVGDAPEWLGPARELALAAFARHGFPTTRDEDWKYTNVTPLAKSGGERLGRSPQPANPDRIRPLLHELPRRAEEPLIVFANGRFSPTLSALPTQRGLNISTAADADEATRRRFIEGSDDDSAFAALNSAFLTDGLILDIDDGADVGAPVHVVFATDGDSTATQARLLVNAGERSTARIVEHHVSAGPGWTNAHTDLHCGASSRLTYVKLQDEHHDVDHIARQRVQLERNSRFRAAHVDLGARLARNDLDVRIAGRGGEAELFGLFLVDGRRHVDNHTRTDHLVGHTVSREHYRGIVSERGQGVFNGKIIVHDGANGTDAQLDNRNLLLSKTAEIDTKPELEIYTDDVKCAHGATTGQLDERALFYLRTRGIARADAEHMLVLAFAREVFERFDPTDAALLNYINRTLERRLPE